MKPSLESGSHLTLYDLRLFSLTHRLLLRERPARAWAKPVGFGGAILQQGRHAHLGQREGEGVGAACGAPDGKEAGGVLGRQVSSELSDRLLSV